MDDLAIKIRDEALKLGYEKCGIIKVDEMYDYEDRLNERIEKVPITKGFYSRYYNFAHLQDTYPWAKSIVVCIKRYDNYHVPEHLQGVIGKTYMFDSRVDEKSKEFQDGLKFEKYMQGLGIKTHTERKFGVTGMRWAALKAGLGIIRRNNFFYTEKGSWLTIEAWVIDEELEYKETPNIRACSEKCNLCIKACPSKSLSEPYTMNPLACVSCLTTFAGRDMPNEIFKEAMGDWVYGCDVCQDSCPMNKNKWIGNEDFPNLEELSKKISLEKIIKMDYDFLENVLQKKFWYIPKNDVWKWKVNAINAMINNYKEEYKTSIYEALEDSNQKVREMADFAIKKLNI